MCAMAQNRTDAFVLRSFQSLQALQKSLLRMDFEDCTFQRQSRHIEAISKHCP